MARLITQSIDEAPLFIVVGNNTSLTRGVSDLLVKNGFQTQIINWSEISISGEKLKQAYKVVAFWSGEKLEDLINIQGENILVVVPVIPQINSQDNGVGEWKKQADLQHRNIAQAIIENSQVSWLFIEGLLFENHPLVGFIASDLSRKQLNIPQDELILLDEENLLNKLGLILLTPWRKGDKTLLIGESVNLLKLFKKVAINLQKVWNVEPELTAIQAKFNSFAISTDKKLEVEINQSKIISQLTKILSGMKVTKSSSPELKREISAPVFKPEIKLTEKINPVKKPEKQPILEIKKPSEKKSVDVQIQKLFAQQNQLVREMRVEQLSTVAKDIKKKKVRKSVFFWIGLVFVGIGVTTGALYSGMLVSSAFLNKTLSSHGITNISNSQTQNSLSRWVKFTQPQINMWQRINPSLVTDEIATGVELSSQVVQAIELRTKLNKSSSDLVLAVLGVQNTDVFEVLSHTNTQSQDLYQHLSEIKELLNGETVSDDWREDLDKERKNLSLYLQANPVLSVLLGQQERRTYAVILQDNQELRPTGGFISAVALVTFNQGQLVDYQVKSVYELDSLFSGSVEPPADLNRFLGEKKLYLRDSNWSADFPTSAAVAVPFIQGASNKKIDGVVAITLDGLATIIGQVGPLELADFNEVITDKNLWERAEFHSEVTFSDQVGQKQYLVTVLDALLKKMSSLSPEKANGLVAGMSQTIKDNEMLIYLTRPEEQSSINVLGWTGSLIQPDCPAQFYTDVCLVDTLMQVEANVGVNKANYSLKRQVNHQITVGETDVTHHRVVTLNNQAKTNAWPQGTYKSYLRWYLPSDAKNIAVTVNNQVLNESDLFLRFEKGRRVVGVLIDVPVQEERQIELDYQIPIMVSESDERWTYTYFEQKQPGSRDSNWQASLRLAEKWRASIIAPQTNITSGDYIFLQSNASHQFIGAELRLFEK